MKIFLFLCAVVALSATSEALKCYECSPENPKCNDPFDKNAEGMKEVTCPTNLQSCWKAACTLTNGTVLTKRSCVDRAVLGDICSGDTTVQSKTRMHCDSDFCNGATTMSITVTTLIVLVSPLIFRTWF